MCRPNCPPVMPGGGLWLAQGKHVVEEPCWWCICSLRRYALSHQTWKILVTYSRTGTIASSVKTLQLFWQAKDHLSFPVSMLDPAVHLCKNCGFCRFLLPPATIFWPQENWFLGLRNLCEITDIRVSGLYWVGETGRNYSILPFLRIPWVGNSCWGGRGKRKCLWPSGLRISGTNPVSLQTISVYSPYICKNSPGSNQ